MMAAPQRAQMKIPTTHRAVLWAERVNLYERLTSCQADTEYPWVLRVFIRSIIPVIQSHRSTGHGTCCDYFKMDGGRILSSEICLISVTVTEDRFNYEMLCYPCASNQNRLCTSQQLLHHAGKISTSVAAPAPSPLRPHVALRILHKGWLPFN